MQFDSNYFIKNNNNFATVTLVDASYIFLPRDAMHKRGLCRHAVSVCLYVCVCLCVCVCVCVCLSVTFANSVKMNKRIINFFSPSGSQAILVFLCQTA